MPKSQELKKRYEVWFVVRWKLDSDKPIKIFDNEKDANLFKTEISNKYNLLCEVRIREVIS